MITPVISSQDFRNSYEKFYNRIRNYLWPLETLKVLANVEENIYSAFIDYKELRKNLERLQILTKQVTDDDKFLEKAYKELFSLLGEAEKEGTQSYLAVYQVEEMDPELNKVMKVEEETENEDNEETAINQSI